MIFACSYSLRPWIVTPSEARETVPETNNMSPTRRALDHRPGGGSATWGLIILWISIVSSFIKENWWLGARIFPQAFAPQTQFAGHSTDRAVAFALEGSPLDRLRVNSAG